jgi:hypothetical protein
VGSDTGLLHATQDGGQTWQDITPKGLPDWSRVTQIEASHFEPGTAYATVDRHRREDYKPYIYRTRDFGKSWTLAVDGLAAPAYVNGIREDPARKGLLYAATELGVAVSFDDADHWQPLQLNLPTVSVRDLVVHDDDLAIATHGRGFWILDDITPLRQTDAAGDVVLYKPATAYRLNPEGFFGTPIPPEEPQAKNPIGGAVIDYYFKAAPADASVEIVDGNGQVVRTYSTKDGPPAAGRRQEAIADLWIAPAVRLTARAGMNRFAWDLRYKDGPLVLPGTYQVRLKAAGKVYTQPLVVKLDPRSTATAAELAKQFEFSMQCWKAIEQARSAGQTQVVMQLTTAMQVAQSADRMPPATAYAIYEEATRQPAR